MSELAIEQIQVSSIREIQDAVRSKSGLLPKGGGTKNALSSNTNGDSATLLDMSGLASILEYQPDEYTFTALAGTKVTDVEAALAKNGQYLPFEPPLAQRGATLGGTVAAGLSGSARYRYGGVRDFLLGLRFVDGSGQLVTGGGKVVKNAAGFDLPKLMVGSLGRFGILTELTFKVFPAPRAYMTLLLQYDSLPAGIDAVRNLTVAPYDIEALDLVPLDGGAQVEIRLGGIDEVLPERADRILNHLSINAEQISDRLRADDDLAHWHSVRDFDWATSAYLVKVPTTPAKIANLDKILGADSGTCRYCVGGNLAWVAWSDEIAILHQLLNDSGLSGLVVSGDDLSTVADPMIGVRTGHYFAQRIKAALDPDERFYGKIGD